MPATYTLIASNTLSSSAASVTFSAIPATYTDLVLRMSMRISTTGDSKDNFYVWFNGSSAASYSLTRVRGDGTTASSSRATAGTYSLTGLTDRAGATANTFGSAELYIPNYTASTNKPSSLTTVSENNATEAYIEGAAGLWSNTAAITSIGIYGDYSGNQFVSGSSFFLYGIKNS